MSTVLKHLEQICSKTLIIVFPEEEEEEEEEESIRGRLEMP